jgi:DNA-binding MarR family transcriptional regulator
MTMNPTPSDPTSKTVQGEAISEPPRIVTELFRLQDAEALFECRVRDMFGLRATDYAAIRYVAREESFGRTPRSRDLTLVLGITHPATSNLVDRLVDAGHLTRHPDPADGRGRTVHLTTDTRDLFDQANQDTWNTVRHALTTLSSRDQNKIADLFASITDALDHGGHHTNEPPSPS